MRFSLRLNNDLTLPEYVSLAKTAESVGFDQFWVSHDLFLRSAPIILSAVGQATSRIEIGSCIFNPYTINPAELAMMAATLDELTDCRFNLGLAAGAASFLGWIGLEHGSSLAAMRESIEAVRALLRGEVVARNGRFLNWQPDAYLRFPAPRVTPIYLGAMGPKMLALAGELADGVLPLLFPPEHYFGVKPIIERGFAKRAAALPPLDLAACIWVSLAEEETAARRVLAEKIADYGSSLRPLILQRLGVTQEAFGPIEAARVEEKDMDKAVGLGDERMMRIGVVGDPKQLLERLEPLVAAGVTHLSFGPPLGPDPETAVRMLGEKVLPHFA